MIDGEKKHPSFPIFIVDDEMNSLKAMEKILRSGGFDNLIPISNGIDLMVEIREKGADLVILDICMPILRGDEILVLLQDEFPVIPVMMVTALNDVDSAVDCLKKGACDYFVKPVEMGRFISRVRHLISQKELMRENRSLTASLLTSALVSPENFSDIIYCSDKIHKILKYIEAIACSSFPVLITGDTGVGKELIAQAIHKSSNRSGACVSINVAGIDDSLLSDTLFGHVPGAFTGAKNRRAGLVASAARGTLFLDEIGDMTQFSQVKLLRLIQEREYYPVGSDSPGKSEARIVTATCKSLEDLRVGGTFRKDLYYRLYTHHIHVPPLRDRREDIPLLINHFLRKAIALSGKEIKVVSDEVYDVLIKYDFPGNVRELESIILDAVTLSKCGKIVVDSIFEKVKSRSEDYSGVGRSGLKIEPPYCSDRKNSSEKNDYSGYGQSDSGINFFCCMDKLPTIKQAEECLVREALSRSSGILTDAARLLGISRQALGQRLKRWSRSI
ncbi:MAG: two-component system response regulator [Candidatus Wallbacteria bacterium HGW-Wallbacteria-1]|jgi:DNA-binding NtrC family response regulator|uniref:Two-component system response regulator n=1 Tax=Candidatus Wallbacteria bacterium HGW-Wallbacteria-1 TaxID=2013854 RepID=A0A2N1PNR1_9BACT|nr:MAG: two-component system response regulator [Candidatus Wallbacteria bacterium HGW-Wallbacteria-1]